jgi:HK97 family phage portal protein
VKGGERMGIKDLFKRAEEVEPVVDDVLLRALLSGETIDRNKAMTLPAVSGAVNFITDTVAMIPIKLYREKNGTIEEVKKDKRVDLLNDDTKDTLDGFQFKKAIVEDYLLDKGGYAYIKKNKNDFVGLYYTEAKNVTVNINTDPIFKSYDLLVGAKRYQPFEFIKLLRNTKDGASGQGVTVEVSKALETAYQTLLYQLNLVKSGGNKKGFIKSQRPLDQKAIDTLKNAWNKMYANNEENVVVLNNGLEFQESSNSSVEMQLNENKRTLQDEINNIFHIENSYELTFKKAIAPILTAFETALNRDFLLEKEKNTYFWAFDTKEITKASLKERFEAYKIAKECGFMTKNEMRYLENMDNLEGLDVIDVGLGSVLFNTKTQEYYTPNTNTTKTLIRQHSPSTCNKHLFKLKQKLQEIVIKYKAKHNQQPIIQCNCSCHNEMTSLLNELSNIVELN